MRIGVCSDIHGHAQPLMRVLDEMAKANVSERWCLGDLVGGGPDPAGVVTLARELDLCLMGNHDAWMLAGRWWPDDARKLRGSDAAWLASLRPSAGRYGVRCWHGTPSQPLLDFLDARAAPNELFALAPGTLGLVGHTHVPIAYLRERLRVWDIAPTPETTVFLDPAWIVIANPGAVAGSEFDPAAWWLELDLEEGWLRWHRG
jgi:predicted phosphodiesterase